MTETKNVSEKGLSKQWRRLNRRIFAGVPLLLGILYWILGGVQPPFLSWQKAKLAVGNIAGNSEPERGKLRFVLGWLEDDSDGSAKKTVTDAFKALPDAELVESARTVKTSGPSWKEIREDARGKLLAKWGADMAIVGHAGPADTEGLRVLKLYFVPNERDCEEGECIFDLFGNDCTDSNDEGRKCAANMQAAYSFVRATRAGKNEKEILESVTAFDEAAAAYDYADPAKLKGTPGVRNILDAARSAVHELSIRDCEECPQMAVIPAGSFEMGSPDGEKDREKDRETDEGPMRLVKIESSLAVGKYEVTFREWDACVKGGGCRDYRPNANGWGRGDRPVINVSWNDARAYVRWLGEETGREYRLLSEAEWEYAARAGTRTRYSFGDDITHEMANYLDSGHKKTVSVGSYKANGFGLYDMHGNVWEWVQDCWNDSYRGAPSNGDAWERGDCSRRVLRGGSWYVGSGHLRSAVRDGKGFGFRFSNGGFRVARTLKP